MRKFLYITPYFPPLSRVGALRPLKFARHLPGMGWTPVVLCDLWRGAATDPELLDVVPEDVVVCRDYTRRAVPAWERFLATPENPPESVGSSRPGLERLVPDWLTNPELVPLSDHAPYMRYSTRTALRLTQAHDFSAVVVNADPHEALLVGAAVSKQTGLPLVLDLRDPWSVCELRRPMRPFWTRWAVDRLERRCVEQANRVVLNTEATLAAYRAHYCDLAEDRFTVIRNHGDRGLIGVGEGPRFGTFTMLFLGHFRRFVEGDVLLRGLAELKQRGVSAEGLRLVVTGRIPPATRDLAEQLGVADYLEKHEFVPYTHIGPVMEAADLLVLLNNRTVQRIPAKFYDYVMTSRPILAVADNPELHHLVDGLVGGVAVGLDDAAGVADAVQRVMAQPGGGAERAPEDAEAFSTATASRAMARVLDEACA